MLTRRSPVRGWFYGCLAAALALALAGCGGGRASSVEFTAPPAPRQGATPLDLFYVATENYFHLYTSGTSPFNPASQLASEHYPVPFAYQTQAEGPSGYQLPLDSELAIMTLAQADPRVSAVSGAPLGSERVKVLLVESISYGGATNIIGLTKLLSGSDPRFEVLLATKDPLTGAPMTAGELAKILTHEFGHVFGLGHSPDERDLMYFRDNPLQGATRQTFLTFGDAMALWSTLNNRRVQWYPDRPVITRVEGAAAALARPLGRVATITDDGGEVVCVYTKP